MELGFRKKCQKMHFGRNILDISIMAMVSKAKLSKLIRDVLLINKQTIFMICTLMWKEVGALDFVWGCDVFISFRELMIPKHIPTMYV